MTPLAPMKSTIPNSLTVSSRQRLPPAIAAGRAAGRMTLRPIRQGLAPSRPATSIWLLIDKREGGEQRPQHERRVDGNLRKDHAPGRIKKVNWRLAQAERLRERSVQHAGRSVEKGEGKRHQEGRQRNESVDQPRHKCRTGKRNERQDQRQRHPQGQATGGGGERDQAGIDERIEKRARVKHGEKAADIDFASVANERRARDQEERIEECEPKDDERRRDPESIEVESRRRLSDGEIRHRLLLE